MCVVKAENISKGFLEKGAQNRVLRHIDLCVREGEFVSVMGPSGSGKSTLLFCVSGMDGVDEGRVEFDGRDLATLEDEALSALRRTQMGFVFQQPSLLKNLNLLDNIMLTAVRNDKKNLPAIKARALALMEKAGIASLADRDVAAVSGGQLQRAGVCRALMSHPSILFGDEPTGALNSAAAQEVMRLFQAVNTEGTAILLVTHDAKIAAHSERVIFMCDGQIADEMLLGKYDGGALDARMRKVSERMQGLGI